jgi:hypothetical protein
MLTETRDKHWREHIELLRTGIDDATLQTVLQRIRKNKLAEALISLASEGSGPVQRGPVLRVVSVVLSRPLTENGEFSRHAVALPTTGLAEPAGGPWVPTV